jgi:hypothetical protein
LRNLKERECRFISKSTTDYNCVGFAAADYLWWHPQQQDEHFWPEGVPRDFWAKTYVQALATVHFEVCPIQSPAIEDGYEKIVIYHRGSKFSHVAVIAGPALWKSKLGEFEDIEHAAAARKMGEYGLVFKYLRRELKWAGAPLPEQYRILK